MKKDLVYSLVINFQRAKNIEGYSLSEYMHQIPNDILKISCFSALIRFRLLGKVSEE